MPDRSILLRFSTLGILLLIRQWWLVLERRARYLYVRWIVRKPLFYRQVGETGKSQLLDGTFFFVYTPTLYDVFEWQCCWALTYLQLWEGRYPDMNAYQVIIHTVNHQSYVGAAILCPARIS